MVGTLHLIHISSFSKHLVNNGQRTLEIHVLRCIFLAALTPVLLVVFNNAVCCMAVIEEQSCIDIGETNTHKLRGPSPSAPFC